MTLRSEYTRAVTKEMNRRQEIRDIIDEYCSKLPEPEKTIVQAKMIDGTLPVTIRAKLFRMGIFISYEDLQRLTKIVLRPLAAELGIRITKEPDGNAAEIIQAARKEYERRQAEKEDAQSQRQTRRASDHPTDHDHGRDPPSSVG